jgi:hypothetical protein
MSIVYNALFQTLAKFHRVDPFFLNCSIRRSIVLI